MKNEVSIRHALPTDVLNIHQLIEELESKKMDFTTFEHIFLHNISLPNNHYFVAVFNTELVGFISCHGQLLLHHLGWVFEIQEMVVANAYRSLGIGSLLLNHLQSELHGKNMDSLEVCSNQKRVLAHQFYIKNGFSNSHFKFTKKLPI